MSDIEVDDFILPTAEEYNMYDIIWLDHYEMKWKRVRMIHFQLGTSVFSCKEEYDHVLNVFMDQTHHGLCNNYDDYDYYNLLRPVELLGALL